MRDDGILWEYGGERRRMRRVSKSCTPYIFTYLVFYLRRHAT